MRIHTDVLIGTDFYIAAAAVSGVSVSRAAQFGSRTRQAAFDLKLEAEQRKGRRRINFGTADVDRFDAPFAPTWDEWGMVFGHLFAVDPNLVCGSNYSGLDHFEWTTGKRFVGRTDGPEGAILNVGTPCDNHQWDAAPANDHTGGLRCRKGCGATLRRVFSGGGFEATFDRRWSERKYPIPTRPLLHRDGTGCAGNDCAWREDRGGHFSSPAFRSVA